MEDEAEEQGDDGEEDRRDRDAENVAEAERGEGIGDAEARGGVGGDVDEAADDRHAAERRDERIDAEIGNQPAIGGSDEKAGSKRADDPDRNAELAGLDHDRRADDVRQRRDRADGEIEAAEDDREGHAAGNDADHGVLLKDIDDVLVGAEGRLPANINATRTTKTTRMP